MAPLWHHECSIRRTFKHIAECILEYLGKGKNKWWNWSCLLSLYPSSGKMCGITPCEMRMRIYINESMHEINFESLCMKCGSRDSIFHSLCFCANVFSGSFFSKPLSGKMSYLLVTYWEVISVKWCFYTFCCDKATWISYSLIIT